MDQVLVLRHGQELKTLQNIMTDDEKKMAAMLRNIAHVCATDTPRTEAHVKKENNSGHWADMDVCDPEFARQLEREVNAMRAKIRQLRENAMTREAAMEESVEIISELRADNTRLIAWVAMLRETIRSAMDVWERDPRTPNGGIYDSMRKAILATYKD